MTTEHADLLARLDKDDWDVGDATLCAAHIRSQTEEIAALHEQYRLLSAQHARLCDQVYEEDGETLKIERLRAQIEAAARQEPCAWIEPYLISEQGATESAALANSVLEKASPTADKAAATKVAADPFPATGLDPPTYAHLCTIADAAKAFVPLWETGVFAECPTEYLMAMNALVAAVRALERDKP